jgi:hypothetical protein
MSRALHTIVAATVLVACADSSVEPGAAPTARDAAVALDAASSRPAGGSCTFHSVLLPPEPGQPANVRHLHIDEVCQLLHLGRAIGSAEETSTFTATGPVITNSTTYTAANGDQVFVTFSGTGTLPVNGVVTFSGTETVTGGTGRFAGASGSLERAGAVSIFTQTGEFETSGAISY